MNRVALFPAPARGRRGLLLAASVALPPFWWAVSTLPVPWAQSVLWAVGLVAWSVAALVTSPRRSLANPPELGVQDR
ncbi:hypothetical protein [Actinoplanes sp. NPDC049802]|uniref:hypothetical protein n=1 Tax=Actinoplanes sp. NPDC049802 TaxID=3154742 RepID=UPI0033FA8D4A